MNQLLNPVKLDLNLEKIHLTVQLKLINSDKNIASAHVMYHAKKRTNFICNNIIMQNRLLQLNYSVIFNTFTPLIKYFNEKVFYNIYNRLVRYVVRFANCF
jgi:hypothetical protein